MGTSTSTVTATRNGATSSVTRQGMHPLFHELFVVPGDGRGDGARRATRTRAVAVRTVRRGISRRAAQGAWA